ncbi:MAG: hypothetical protein HY557_07370 [Euryarchaeota archaeon]|nr:hypothetical protein [Euryarchaeota archaeon]
MTPADDPKNRIFTDMVELRGAVEALLEQRRFRVTEHARTAHPEFSDVDRLAIVRWGGQDTPDRDRDPSEGIYLCWAQHPRHGLCRAVYAIETTSRGDILVIISVMPEE